jgi:hypothetical protein
MAKIINRRKRVVTLVAAAGLAVAGTGVAFAYWTAQGSGSGAAQTGEITPFTIVGGTATGGPLSPDGPTQAVPFTVTNPGTGTQQLTTISAFIGTDATNTWATAPFGDDADGCTSADFTVEVTTDPVYGAVPSLGVRNGVATVSMIDTGENQDACQAVHLSSVPVYFTTAAPVAN